MRSSCLMPVGSKSSDKCPCKRKAEGDLKQTQRKPCKAGDIDWSEKPQAEEG